MRSRIYFVALLGFLVLFAAGSVAGRTGTVAGLLLGAVPYDAVYVLGALICLGASRRSRAERTAWLGVGGGLALAAVACTQYSIALLHHTAPAFPSIGDVLNLVALLAIGAGLLALLRARAPRTSASVWLDGLIGALGAAAAASAVVLPALGSVPADPVAAAVTLAYPVTGILLLVVLGVVGGILGLQRDPGVLLLAGSIAMNLAGDLAYLQLSESGSYESGAPVDAVFLAAVALVAWGAQLSPMRPVRSTVWSPARTGWREVLVPLVCNALSLLVLVLGADGPGLSRWCALGCIAASVLRSAITVVDVRDLHTARTLARTDELTGLANRRALMVDGPRLVAEASGRHPLALLLLDLDGFKQVNDTLGHHAGDALLRQVGPRLGARLRPGDLLVRLGGDEFAVLLPDTVLADAAATAHDLRTSLLEPFTVADVRLHVGVSIGVAAASVPATDLQELMHHADVAMYTAKSERTGVRVHLPEPGDGTGDRLRTIEELRAGLSRGELEVHLQPLVALADGAVVGAEALVRWRHPVRGLLTPADLLPAAEQAGLLRPLTDTVLDLALTAAAGWWDDTAVRVAVNLSAADVTDLDLPGKVADALRRHGLPAAALTLELVEDTLMADPDRGRTVLAGLRDLGVRTSIDDYGTGHSSLAHLPHLAADEIKLDRSLTAGLTDDVRTLAVVRHTIALAHDLGLDLVAEGVEDTTTAAALADLGCDAVQGWCIAHPMPVPDFRSWLQLQQRPVADDIIVR